jgi:hypothetical protein
MHKLKVCAILLRVTRRLFNVACEMKTQGTFEESLAKSRDRKK